jgi:flagellar basal-body rod modification protein FlgD
MTTTGKIDDNYYLSSVPKRTPSSTLEKDDFLQILVTQLQNQDPTSPMDDTKFVDQMTSYSSLEQMINIGEAVTKIAGNQPIISPVLQYSNLIGKDVTYHEYDPETQEITKTLTSTVEAVSQKNGYAVLELSSGKEIYADAVTKVSNQ